MNTAYIKLFPTLLYIEEEFISEEQRKDIVEYLKHEKLL
jgi:hypothetical protein